MRRRKSTRGASATQRYRPTIDLSCRRLVRQRVVAFAKWDPPRATVTWNMKFMANRDVGKRVAEHRVRLRDQGLRPLQIWVPDTRAPEFAEEAHRQSALAAAIDSASDDQAFVDAISQFNDEDFDA